MSSAVRRFEVLVNSDDDNGREEEDGNGNVVINERTSAAIDTEPSSLHGMSSIPLSTVVRWSYHRPYCQLPYQLCASTRFGVVTTGKMFMMGGTFAVMGCEVLC